MQICYMAFGYNFEVHRKLFQVKRCKEKITSQTFFCVTYVIRASVLMVNEIQFWQSYNENVVQFWNCSHVFTLFVKCANI